MVQKPACNGYLVSDVAVKVTIGITDSAILTSEERVHTNRECGRFT